MVDIQCLGLRWACVVEQMILLNQGKINQTSPEFLQTVPENQPQYPCDKTIDLLSLSRFALIGSNLTKFTGASPLGSRESITPNRSNREPSRQCKKPGITVGFRVYNDIATISIKKLLEIRVGFSEVNNISTNIPRIEVNSWELVEKREEPSNLSNGIRMFDSLITSAFSESACINACRISRKLDSKSLS